MSDEVQFIKGTRRERVVTALAAPVLAAACAWCFSMVEPALGDTRLATQGSRFVLDLFHLLCTELFATALVFLTLAFIWALFRPHSIVRLMTLVSQHVWRAVCLVVVALLVGAFIGSLIKHVA